MMTSLPSLRAPLASALAVLALGLSGAPASAQLARPGAASDTKPLPVDLLANPFNKHSAHHRPIGKGAEAGVPGGCHYDDVRKEGVQYDKPGEINSRGCIANVGAFRLGKSKLGRKWTYEVNLEDPLVTIVSRSAGEAHIRMPADANYPTGQKSGANVGDFNALFYPRNGLENDVMDQFTGFNYKAKTATTWNTYPLAGLDMIAVQGNEAGEFHGATGASRMRWPSGVLRGFEINPDDPGPMRHALHCTATRIGVKSAQILSRRIVWPSSSVDGSAKKNLSQNLGDIPYGTRLFIRASDYETVKNKIGENKRGLVLLDVLSFYGCYIFDGQGEVVGGNKGVLQIRIDGEVGLTPDGKEINGVIERIESALQIMLPYIYPLRNPRPHWRETELWDDGLPYAGGGGPLDPVKSRNTAWDAQKNK